MTRFLPSRPSLMQLRNQAKDVLKAHRAGDSAACPILRRLPRFAEASDRDILTAAVALADVQFALACDYGFPHWAALKQFAESAAPRPAPPLVPAPAPGAGAEPRSSRAFSLSPSAS